MIRTIGTHFNYYMICKRKLWLFANGISMEHTSDLVYEGKIIHESVYPQRSEHYEELEIDGIKIDYYDVRNKIVHEIKKSNKMDVAHEWQVKYYIYVLEKQGIEGVTGILEYPLLRKKEVVVLSDIDRERLEEIKSEIETIIHSESCPGLNVTNACKNCSYYEFCLSGEKEE